MDSSLNDKVWLIHLWHSTWFMLLTPIFIILFIIGYLWYSLPSKKEITQECFVGLMNQVPVCPSNNQFVRLSEVPQHFIDLLLLSEDSRFWQHKGFDFEEIQNSFETNRKRGYFARGASTITQQLAKNMFLYKEKSLWRKFKEALITIQLEKYLSKKQILEKYINLVEFGNNIYGLKKASLFYFSLHPKELNYAQSAFLVFLLPNPGKYSQSFKQKKLTEFAQRRLIYLLSKALKNGKIPAIHQQLAFNQLANLFGTYSLFIPLTDLSMNIDTPPEDTSEEIANSSEDMLNLDTPPTQQQPAEENVK